MTCWLLNLAARACDSLFPLLSTFVTDVVPGTTSIVTLQDRGNSNMCTEDKCEHRIWRIRRADCRSENYVKIMAQTLSLSFLLTNL